MEESFAENEKHNRAATPVFSFNTKPIENARIA